MNQSWLTDEQFAEIASHLPTVRWAAKGVWVDLFETLASAGGPPAQAPINSSAARADDLRSTARRINLSSHPDDDFFPAGTRKINIDNAETLCSDKKPAVRKSGEEAMRVTIGALLAIAFQTSAATADIIVLKLDQLPAELKQRLAEVTGPQPMGAAWGSQQTDIERRTRVTQIKKDIANAYIGLGYDIWKGELSEKCATAKTIVPAPMSPNGKNPHNADVYRQIESYREYDESRSSGGSVDLKYNLFSFSLGAQSGTQTSFKSTSKSIDVFKRSIGDEFFGSEWSPAQAASTSLAQSAERFAEVCGQRFIHRVGFGVQLDGQLHANIKIDESAKNNKVNVGIGFGKLIGIEADTAKTMQDLRSASELSVNLAGAGGVGPKAEEFIEYVRTFGEPAEVGGSYHVVFLLTKPYLEISNKLFSKFEDVTEAATGSVLRFTDDRRRALQQFQDLTSARDNDTYLEVVDQQGAAITDINAEIQTQTIYLDRLSGVYMKCRVAITETKVKDCVDEANKVGPPPRLVYVRLKAQKDPA